MGAIDGQHAELMPVVLALAEIADEHAGMRRHAVPRLANGIVERHQARLPFGEVFDGTETNALGTLFPQRSQEEPDEGYAENRRGRCADGVGQPVKEGTAFRLSRGR